MDQGNEKILSLLKSELKIARKLGNDLELMKDKIPKWNYERLQIAGNSVSAIHITVLLEKLIASVDVKLTESETISSKKLEERNEEILQQLFILSTPSERVKLKRINKAFEKILANLNELYQGKLDL